MKQILSEEQAQDLAVLNAIAKRFSAQIVIIGVVALACFINEPDRFTSDIDLVIALDLEGFAGFAGALTSAGWSREKRREHRWKSSHGSLIDILPAGPALRAAKRITWPESRLEMNLTGFDHVFTLAITVEFGRDVRFNVAPLAVVALLKIVAFLDDPRRRAKDLLDLKFLFRSYEAETSRIFSDEVFGADLEDIEFASAFLLGFDIGALATPDDFVLLNDFVNLHLDQRSHNLDKVDDWEALRFQRQLLAFDKGATTASQRA